MTASPNLDLVRSIYAAFERGDFSSVQWMHPDIEFTIVDGPSPGSWTGPAGMAEGFRSFLNAWEELRVEAEGFRELDHGRVLVLVRLSGRGKTSGMELEQMRARGADVHHVRGGKVTKFVLYWDREQALADLGLAPEGSST